MNRAQWCSRLALLCSIASLAACSPTKPSQSPGSPKPPITNTGVSLTGTVFHVSAHGRQPLPGAHVFVTDLVEGPYGNAVWFQLLTDSEGRFSTDQLFPGSTYKIYAAKAFGLLSEQELSQLRAVQVVAVGTPSVEVELLARGVEPSVQDSPVLSGTVFIRTADGGRRPAADVGIYYSSYNHDGVDAYGRTDAEGRYRFWNVPISPGLPWPSCKTFDWSVMNASQIRIDGDTTYDIDCF